MLELTASLRQAISQRQAAQSLISLASKNYVSMRTDGLIKAAQGLATVDAVLRATQDTDEAEV